MTGLIGDTASSNVSIMYSKGRPKWKIRPVF